jgi:hypothetical protein
MVRKKNITSGVVSETAAPQPIIADKDIIWYVKEICGGKEIFTFDTQEETDAFGKKLRENNQGMTNVHIDVSYLNVRVTITD